MSAPLIPADVRESLDAVLSYNWDDEYEDWADNDRPEGHVFKHMSRINDWMYGPDRTPVRARGRIIGFIVSLRRGSFFEQTKQARAGDCVDLFTYHEEG